MHPTGSQVLLVYISPSKLLQLSPTFGESSISRRLDPTFFIVVEYLSVRCFCLGA